MGDIKEIFEVWASRAKSPLFGYFSLSFVATNWKAIFFLLFADKDVISRIEYFDSNTCAETLLWIPLGISIVAALSYPWIQFVFLYATTGPINLRNKLNAKSESNLLLVKVELENARNELIRQREKEIIDKAQIDEKLEDIDDESAREKARSEIKAIRDSEGLLRQPINRETLQRYLLVRFPNLPVDRKIITIFLNDLNLNRYKLIGDVEEVLNSSKEFVEFYKEKKPEVFKSSIDYVTKSFGYFDQEFRKKHGFSNETRQTMEDYTRT